MLVAPPVLERALGALGLQPTPVALLATLSTLAAGLYLLAVLAGALRGNKGGKLPPGPLFHIPFLGDSVLLATGNPNLFFFGRHKRYGPVYRTMMLGARIWVVTDMDAMRGVLNDRGGMLDIPFPSFKTLMGPDSIFLADGVHGPWRKMFLQALAPARLAEMVPRVLEVMRAHLARWEANGSKVPIYRSARAMGLDLAVDVITKVQLKRTDPTWFKAQVELFLDGLYGLPYALPGTPLAKALAAKERLIEALRPEMADLHATFLAKWDESGKSISEFADKVMGPSADGGAAGADADKALRPSVMVAQLMGRAAIGHAELRDAALGVLHMLVASGDTTRFALFNTWSLLASSPRVQEQLYVEQQAVIAEHGPELSYQALAAMPYLDATVKECMRLLPASAGGLRKLTEDMRVGEYTIPKGEFVWYHAGLLHCVDPALYDGDVSAPLPKYMDWRGNFHDAFRPERWLEGGSSSEAARPRSYYTFGTGVHSCAGEKLVLMEVKLLLALVLRKYRLRLETPDMLLRCERLFPFFVPAPGTDNVLLEPREAPAPAA